LTEKSRVSSRGENRLKELIGKDKTAIGPFMKFTDPAAAEIAGYAGFDFIIVDLEHGPLSIERAQDIIRAAQLVKVTPIIRVSENCPAKILRALDIGAQGVEIPHIVTREDAEKAVQAAKFSPEGERGVCRFVRAAAYSHLDRYQYFKKSNEETMVIAHIEGVEGIANVEDIVQVSGLDILFLGPYDLSQSCKIPGQIDHPLVIKKMQRAVEVARERGLAVGTFVETKEEAQKWIKAGVRYISFSVDVGIYYKACARIVEDLRNIMV